MLLYRFLLAASFVTVSVAYLAEKCRDENGDEVKGSCTCAYTAPGTYCPENYYCPEYSESDIATYYDNLIANSCTVSNNSLVICPCTPGFYCPENTSQPVYCCKGYYCPATDLTSVSGSSGIGAWGARIKKCPEGTFCMQGQVDPFECTDLSDCPEGSTEADNRGLWILLVLLIVFMYIFFAIRGFYLSLRRKTQDRVINQELKEDDGNDDYIQETPMFHASPVPAVSPFNVESQESASRNPLSTGGGDTDIEDKLAPVNSFHIEFDNLGLVLKNGTRVMQGVCGEFKPGRICAIMGSSGAGKTTVMNLITGKVEKTEGTLYVNGEEVSGLAKYRKLVGFVPQEDVMIRELTVRDNISFSAKYRLPADLSKDEVDRKVDACIRELGIPHVQHSIIGDERTRGVSGGQRKRVNIGIELVADPKVLFLDEPTSGLDSTTATSLCASLKKIARRRQMTIASVIHQPSVTSFLEFDDLLLLGKGGRVIYHGAVKDAPAYFESIGFKMPATCNPADFFLDVASGIVPCEKMADFEWPMLFDMWESHRVTMSTNRSNSAADPKRMSVAVTQEMLNAAKENEMIQSCSMNVGFITNFFHLMYCDVVEYLEDTYKDIVDYFQHLGKDDPIRETRGLGFQFLLCLQRALKQVFRGFGDFVMEMVLHLGCGVVISVAAERLEYVGPYPEPICDIGTLGYRKDCALPQSDSYVQVANFMCFGILFASIASAAPTFGNEQVNFWRESSTGLKAGPYFFGKWIANFPRIVCSALFFWIAFSIKHQNTGSAVDVFMIILALYWFGFSLGYVVSQIVSVKSASLAGVLVALLFSVALSGANPSMKDVKEYSQGKQFFWKISGPRWALEAFYISQVHYYEEVPNGPYEGNDYIDVHPGLEQAGYNIDYFDICIRAIFLAGLGWSILALLLMRFTGRDKKK